MSRIKRLKPKEAWQYMQDHPSSVIVDVRTKMEYSFVGHPCGAMHIPWQEAPDWNFNLDFVFDVEDKIPDKGTPLLIVCRSGRRSLAAGNALLEAGYSDVVNVEEGFEGALDENRHRSTSGGWRFHGLPWEQS